MLCAYQYNIRGKDFDYVIEFLLFFCFNSILKVIYLLQNWNSTLRKLIIRINIADHEIDKRVLITIAVNLNRLISAINEEKSLPVLEHLTLDIRENLRIVTELDLPILSRLKEFYFHSLDSSQRFLYQSLKRYAEPNDQLRKIGIGNAFVWDELIQLFGQSSLRTRFVMLPNIINHQPIGQTIDDERLHDRFYKTFTSITW